MAKRGRKDGPEGVRGPVRVSVPLERLAYARLCVLAALSGRDRSEIAAELLSGCLTDVTAYDGRKDGAGSTSTSAQEKTPATAKV